MQHREADDGASRHGLDATIRGGFGSFPLSHRSRNRMGTLPSPKDGHPKEYRIWHAVIGFLHKKDGNDETAKKHWIEALRCTHSRAEQELLRRRIESCRTTC